MILVTGGAGFIGSHLVDRLTSKNHVRVIDNLSLGHLSNLSNSSREIDFIKGDLLKDNLKPILKKRV